MSKTGVPTEHQHVLRSTVITDETPDIVLRDFQVMLDFVAAESPPLTTGGMFPLKALEPLNERLTRRIEHGLSRPQQKSFPHINGLFLLLRATGLTWMDMTGRKPMLMADPDALESWRTLNPDERYFTLLESWLMRGDPEIIGERGGFLVFQPPVMQWFEFFQRLGQENWHGYDDWVERVRYWPGLHNLALMELFGLVTIKDAPALPQKGWQIADVRTTEWGEALLSLLYPQFLDNLELMDKLSDQQDVLPGELQPYIQPYRPQWQRTLQLPDMEFRDGLFVFKVSLDAKVWRQIIIPATSTLDDFSDAILHAYRFDHDHLYRFIYPTRFGLSAEVFHPYMDETPYADEVRIGDLPAQPGFQMVYNYDFGDNWLFDVLLERIDPPDPKAERYRIGKRQGRSPQQYSSSGWD